MEKIFTPLKKNLMDSASYRFLDVCYNNSRGKQKLVPVQYQLCTHIPVRIYLRTRRTRPQRSCRSAPASPRRSRWQGGSHQQSK